MKKTRMEKGITLVALIITIVVLLILAVVAISAIQNDGLIGKTDDAVKKYNESVKKEQGILDDYLEFLEVGSDIGLLKKYVLGEDGKGRDFWEIYDGVGGFIDDDILPNASKEIEEMYDDDSETESFLYIKYNKNVYKITGYYDEETDSWPTKDLELIYAPQGREGTQVLYDSNGNGKPERWTVITDRNGKLEIIYPNKVLKDSEGNGLVLGGESNIEVTTDLNGDGETGDAIDKAIASYNNAITQINDFCRTTITATNNGGVRSIGASVEKDEPYIDLSSFNQGPIKLKQGESGYNEYVIGEDIWKLKYLYNLMTTDENYWLPSRDLRTTSVTFNARVRTVSSSGTIDGSNLVLYNKLSGLKASTVTALGVRPIVINPVLTPVEEDKIVQYPLTCTDTDTDITAEDNVQLGDVDQNGKLNTSDMSYLISIVSGEIGKLSSKQLIAADMDKDKKITEEDIDVITKYFEGKLELERIATGDASQIKYAERRIPQEIEEL